MWKNRLDLGADELIDTLLMNDDKACGVVTATWAARCTVCKRGFAVCVGARRDELDRRETCDARCPCHNLGEP